MATTSNDAGTIQVLAKRLETIRLPIALDLKKKVERGEKLNELDLQFLKEVLEDAQQLSPLVDRHPEWHELAVKLIQMYKEITAKGLENEQH